MFERRLYFYVDWLLLGAVLMLCAIGVLMIYSTTYDPSTETVGTQFYTQLYALVFALVAFAICLSIDYRTLSNHALLIYAGLVGVLVYALMFGVEAGWGPPSGFLWVRSISSRPSLPRSAWPSSWGPSLPRIGAAHERPGIC